MSAKPGRLVRTLTLAYLAGLVLVPLLFRFIGERWWVITIAMYLPRIGFILPMPLLLLWCAARKQWLPAATMVVVGVPLWLFPIMGYQAFGHREDAEPKIRLMSWNTFLGRIDNEGLYRHITQEVKPDIFVGQATAHRTKELFRADPAGYHTDFDDEFMIASRWPIVDKFFPESFPHTYHRPNFVRYTLQTPYGLIDVFDMHPRSPRTGLEALRGRGLRTRLKSGELPPEDVDAFEDNTALRRAQVEAVAEAVRKAKNPVLVAGDTNLPTLSWLFHKELGQLRDGFSEVGSGLGYTFPTKRPGSWMRIDRILCDDHFRFLSFTVGDKIASDHRYVLAELTKR